jgi:tetratricopeptide (TPR) repeat protein/transcriptional regulator with XRE-family HTH domain
MVLTGFVGALPVAEQPSFSALLRALRVRAGLTQEELADAAKLSTRTISDLERGVSATARPATARLLADALGLAGTPRAGFDAVARGRAPPALAGGDQLQGVLGGSPAVVTTLPRDIAAFTGRAAEMGCTIELAGIAASQVPAIYAIGGMAGVGKTTLAVHAAHQLAARFPDGQLFVPLHGHTPGQRPVDPASALASLLLACGLSADHIPADLDGRAARWRDYLAGKRTLLVLDDATGYKQVRPLLPGAAGNMVLITSRRRLTALEDGAVVTLETLPPDDAADLLVRLAGRAELDPGNAAVADIARLCGYLPLAIGMLARQLHHHPSWEIADLASDLATARDRLELMRAEDLSVAAAFDLSYQNLAPARQRLFRRLGLVPGPSIDAYAAAALDDAGRDDARAALSDLYDRYLIGEPVPGRYVLHDLVREHARRLAGEDDPDLRDAAITRLLDYYLHAALSAAQYIPTWTAIQDPPPATVHSGPEMATPEAAIAWMESERPNLYAVAELAAATDRPGQAVQLAAVLGDHLHSRCDWDEAASMHQLALTTARSAGDKRGQALALRQLGSLGWLTGDHEAAEEALVAAISLYDDAPDDAGQAEALHNLGMVQQFTGDYPASLASRQRAVALARKSGRKLAEAHALVPLADARQMTGEYAAAEQDLHRALTLFRELGNQLGEANALAILGITQRETAQYPASAASLSTALAIYRRLGSRLGEVSVLDDLGILQILTGNYEAASSNLRRALEMTRQLGGRHGEPELLDSLGELATRQSATRQAREYHFRALALLRGMNWPLQRARALEGIGTSYITDGDTARGIRHLKQALAIYRRIRAPASHRVEEALRRHENVVTEDSQRRRTGTA